MSVTAESPSLRGGSILENKQELIDLKNIGEHARTVQPFKTSKHQPLIQGSVSKEAAIATHSALHFDLTPEKEKKIRDMYDRLDADNDGSIDIRDLTQALSLQAHIPASVAPKLLERMKSEHSDRVTYADFTNYVIAHEARLAEVFDKIDLNSDGEVDMAEIKSYCKEMGVNLDDQKAMSIVKKMDQSGSSSVNLNEFQDFMLLYPSTDMRDMVDFWRHNLIIDIGEDGQVPEDFTPQELLSGVWWRHLVAGGVAGAMSRTCTAPFDRIKVYLQVNSTKTNKLGVVSCVHLLHAEGGIKSFWRGNGINVIKIAPESAMKFMCYDQIKRWMQEYKGGAELSTIERLLAGSSAGAISQTAIYPMEVMKTRLALRRTGQLDKGMFHFAHKMYTKEGIKCFYKGYLPNLLGIIPYAGIDLTVYESLKSMYTKYYTEHTEPGVLALLACGTCSSTCGQLASYPLALVRTRLQARAISPKNSTQPDTMVGQFKHILQTEGFTGLYRGITPNFMKVIPAVSISYVVYEKVRKQLGATMT
ncbi:putative calcium-binding mitochondrial carrier F17E5.2 [Caenorhabditis elegans]|uniref:Probable calcium-binding mitochondrial carrier F17E5.2 n=1 Tax=Caenorhabditis elegans TaxID=6239 RepID=CMC3_CAEEL|nr:putative calcium-binding mitochondrial carrier F17E5.2 [Caenorhabditis elegans]Q19529.4 RecName: Full=Probable calcium-binding mitochondrial carrier F17E5.2 [Caenorhabditis elegans]CAA90761.4 Probable calcium-binding mitochondrial carrier F17E5.2 [Caenorhabditis elegans]|eukprot:NP_510081.3 Probable calcium-binding mitochondrial carrier F17E5.2 [Caenorhabditis elegans]